MAHRTVTRVVAFAVGIAVAAVAMADTFNLFQPATGILKGNSATYVTTSAASSDVISLWTSLCNNTSYLRGDGVCATPPGSGGGTVNNVGLAAPASIFSVSGSPVTSTGTLTLSYATGQAATELFGTDGSGNVSLFALTGAYVPPINLASTSNGGITGTLGVAHGGTGAVTLTAHGVLVGEGTSAITGLTALAADNVLMGVASADPAGAAVPNCGSGTQALAYSTSTHAFGCQTISAGTGTVTSVALTAPSVFSITGSPVTSTGTLALTFAGAQTANEFLATPNGTAGAVGLRSIVLPDLPPINLASASNGGVSGNLPVTNLNSGTSASSSTCWFGDGTWKTCGSGGAVTSVGLSLPSVFTVSGSPVTSAGTLGATFATGQTANQVLATPNGLTGAVGLRALVGADIPAVNLAATGNGGVTGSLPYSSLSGTPTIPTGANPSGLIGMAAVNGVATTYARSDATHAIDPAIVPTWTGAHTFSSALTSSTASVTFPQVNITGTTAAAGPLGVITRNQTSTGYSSVRAWNDINSGARALEMDYSGSAYASSLVTNGPTGESGAIGTTGAFPASLYTNNTERVRLGSVGNVTVNAPSSGVPFTVTNASANSIATFNGGNVSGGFVTFQSNGSDTSYWGSANRVFAGGVNDTGLTALGANHLMLGTNSLSRIDVSGAGAVVINAPSSGNALALTGVANVFAQVINTSSTAGQSFGLQLNAGTNTSDTALAVKNQGSSTNYLVVAGDGGVTIGAPTGGNKGLGTLNAPALYVNNSAVLTASGNAATATALASTPSQCSGGQFATGVTANGNANCSTPASGIQNVAYSNVSSTGSLTNNAHMTLFSHSTGTGIYNLSVSGFTATPVCTTAIGPGFAQFVSASSSSSIVQIATYNTSSANADLAFSVTCVQ